MNELMITIGGGQWMYYRTDLTAADKAFQEFTESCDAAGINIDNIGILSAHLRGRDGEDIDSIEF